jgi:hypothetical protein
MTAPRAGFELAPRAVVARSQFENQNAVLDSRGNNVWQRNCILYIIENDDTASDGPS